MTPWEFNPELDTSKSFQAFSLFLELGAFRTLAAAYRLYKRHSQGAKRVPGFFKRWSSSGCWVSRADAWDKYLQQLAIAKHENAAQDVLEKSLTELSNHAAKLGKVQLGLATRAASIANREFRLWEAELDGETIDRPPRYQDVIAILRTLPGLRSDGQDAWERALYVDKLLADMEQQNISEEGLPDGIQWTRFVEGEMPEETLDFE